MRLRINSRATIIEISEHSTWYRELTSKLQNRFKKTFWANCSLINLPIEGEEAKRRFFLLEVYKICSKIARKHDNIFLKKLLDSAHKPIKIHLTSKTSPIKFALLKYSLKDSVLTLNLEESDTFLFWHSVYKFKDNEISYNFLKKHIYFHTPTPRLKEKLSHFLKTKTLLGYSLNHKYYHHTINSFFNLDNTPKNPLEKHYKTLGIRKNASIKTVRLRYITLAKIYHPDFTNNQNKANLTSKFQQIQEAYHAIKSDKKNLS